MNPQLKQAASRSPSRGLIERINDALATRISVMVGTMWAFYVFFIFGLTPLLWPEHQETILYWSNFLQLIFLPVITVGTALLGRATEARAEADHKMIKAEFGIVKNSHREFTVLLKSIDENVKELLAQRRPG